MLTTLDHLPAGVLACRAGELHRHLAGPTLFHLPGRRQPALFVSVLLHGNEDTGWEALRAVLARHEGRSPGRALSLLVGNVAAARAGRRHLDGQPDYNRIWNDPATAEGRMAREVVEGMRRRGVWASVDLHNNTGHNPHYACVNRLDPQTLHLATLFSRIVVYFTRPDSVQSRAFAELCPSVTLECGRPGQPHGVAHAVDYLDACLALVELPTHPVPPHDLDLFHTVATVTVPPDVRFGFGDTGAELDFVPDLDRLNFQELPAGTRLASLRGPRVRPLEVRDQAGREVSERFLTVADGEVHTRVPVMPSMLTVSPEAVRQDCLGYLLERYRLPRPEHS